MKCNYCGKNIGVGKKVTVETGGETIATWCSTECMTKACKRMSRLMRKMSREQLLAIINKDISAEERGLTKK